MSELVIRISGDIKNYEEALDKASKETGALSDTLESVAAKSAIAFAALTAEIGLSVAAFKESEQALNQLSAALQAQGIYSKDLVKNYAAQATELENLTGISDEAIIQAQTSIQAYIGQKAVLPELTLAIANLSAAKSIDLQTTAELIGKGINGQTAALKKAGIEIDDNISKEERMAQIIEKVNLQFSGRAAAIGSGLGALNKLKESFGNLQEAIGERFAPAVEAIANGLSKLFNFIAQNKAITDLIVSFITAATVVTGVVAAAAAAGIAFVSLSAALSAAGIATSAMTLGVRALIGATGLGLLVLLITEIALNWDAIWPRAQAVFQAFVTNIAALASNIGTILSGAFTFDLEQVKQGLAGLKETLKKGMDEATADLTIKPPAIDDEGQNEAQARAAARAAAIAKQKEDLLLESRKVGNEALRLEADRGIQEQVALKKQESELLKQIAEEENADAKASLIEKLETNRTLQLEYSAKEVQDRSDTYEELLASNEEYNTMTDEQQEIFRAKNDANSQSQILTEKTAKDAAAKERLDNQIKEHNTFLINQEKFGTAYATLNKIMNSTIVQGSAKAFGELAQLQTSSNATLKGIGKAAATANVIIKTAESAMSIYAGFSTIPIIGPALGVAGAAAAVAFGAEQVGKINAAADGGLLEGGIPGIDSIPVLAQQGELVVPRRNFDEVVDAVASQRSGTGNESAAPATGSLEVILKFTDNLMDYVEAQLNERTNLGISLRRAES